MSDLLVEIVFALPEKQLLKTVSVESGATIADVVAKSGLAEVFSEFRFEAMALGVWGQKVLPGQKVKEGDRIEVYRPLLLDPREARRQLALAGRTMNHPNAG